jgi:hypothetical protein
MLRIRGSATAFLEYGVMGSIRRDSSMKRPQKPRPRAKKVKHVRINPTADESLQAWTKVIAISVRNELEDIHSRHISDDLMPDLNRAVRRGIYLALRNLFILTNAKHTDDYVRAKVLLWFHLMSLPDYWEHTEMTPEDLAEEDARSDYGVLNIPRVQTAFAAWLHQHAYLWVEGQELRNEPIPLST